LQYVHGCKKCPPLKRHVGNAVHQTLEERTNRRDNYLKEWASSVNEAMACKDYVTYIVRTDCHDENYLPKKLKLIFSQEKDLNNLTDAYVTQNRMKFDELLNIANNNNKLTYIAVIQGFVPGNDPLKPLFHLGADKIWQRRSNIDGEDRILLTKDYLKFLMTQHNFQVTKIFTIYIYRTSKILNSIYKELLDERYSTTSESKKRFIKNVINFSCGFYGLNSDKNLSKMKSCRLVSKKLSRRFEVERTGIDPIGNVNGDLFYYSKLYASEREKNYRKMNISALPLFAAIVEFGKLRLAQILCFFDKYLNKESYRHLYSNTDNAVIALSTKCLEDAVKKNLLDNFMKEKPTFFDANIPGNLKEEWKVVAEKENAWKFVSPITHNYAVVVTEDQDDEKSRHKNSTLSGLSAVEAYHISLEMLNRRIVYVPQERRVNKLESMEKKQQTFCIDMEENDKKRLRLQQQPRHYV